MAKDGSVRGGPRTGSGRKSKALADKIASGNPGGRKLKVIEVPDDLPVDAELEGADMPEIKDYMLEQQKNGDGFDAEEIFRETWLWLKERGCEKLVSVQLVRSYSMSVARWIQCQHAISEYGFLAKHPTTGNAMQSPYVAMAQNYMKEVNTLWYQIAQVVKENCSAEFSGASPQDDIMEQLLRAKK